jgi:surface polysaccharide O-acyltransferase-like enzyme
MNQYSHSIWWIFNLLDSFIRPCAGLFVMISGKLVLGSSRDDGYLSFVWKRCTRILAPFVLWSLIYSFYEAWMHGVAFSWVGFGKEFLEGPTEYHLWFMYMILGLYLLSPLLRRFVRQASPAQKSLAVAAWFTFVVVNFVWPEVGSYIPYNVLVGYGGFFMLGYILDKSSLFRHKTGWLVAAAAAVIILDSGGSWYLNLQDIGVLNEKFYGGMTPVVALQTALAFLILRNKGQGWLSGRPLLRRLTNYLSRESYNIYLIHPLVISVIAQGFLGFTLSEKTGGSVLVGVPFFSAVVLVGCLALSFLLKKIPGGSQLFVLSIDKPKNV